MAAGLGYIEFTTGDVLTAASANGYLASQVVMVFASAAARTSAIASPQEGMVSYLKDTNALQACDGCIAKAASNLCSVLICSSSVWADVERSKPFRELCVLNGFDGGSSSCRISEAGSKSCRY